MRKKYVIGIDGSGINEMLRGIEEEKRWLDEKSKELSEKLASMGAVSASLGFARAIYDGTPDWDITVEARGENGYAVIAKGTTVLFVEFGTGVVHPDNHPEAAKNGMIRGAYGKGHGKQRTWGYYGDPGTNGVVVPKSNGKDVVLTHGNPANMPMYESVKELERELARVVREVFTR